MRLSRFVTGGMTLGLLGVALAAATAADWPQWRGPDRTGVSKETGLLKTWPAEGPKLLWTVRGLGGGYGSLSVARGRLYGMGHRGESETVWAFDAATGKEVWSAPVARANRRPKDYDDGSRSTPTIDGSRVYALGDSGDLVCLDLATGKRLWQKDLVADFGGQVPGWGYSESPLVDGQRLLVTPGGRDATVLALNKTDGSVLWKAALPAQYSAHYSSIIAADVAGKRQYIQFLGGGLVGLSADDGKLLWQYNRHAGVPATIATPIFRDNQVFAATSYGKGGALVRLASDGNGGTSATEVYFTDAMKNKHGGMILVGDHLYGFDEPRTLTCLEFKTGKVAWADRSVGGNASLFYADGNLYVRSQRGTIALVEANPAAYVEKGRFDPPDRSGKEAWAHPVVANGRLYLRDQDVLHCYDVKQPAGGR